MPGETEIRLLCQMIAASIGSGISPQPLYSSLQAFEQSQALESPAPGLRKCIVATNVAETSLTIDGIVYVIDSGLVKQPQWNARIRMGRLGLSPISQASANQRAGRAGRTRPGKCFRVYTKERFDALRSSNIPGIQSSDFAPAMLTMLASGRWELFNQINFISLPHIDFVTRAVCDLVDLGYMNYDGKITESGMLAAKLPVDPKWVFAIEAAKEFDVHQHICGLAAIASVQNSMFIESYTHRQVLSVIRRQWAHPHSDHISQLNAFHAYMSACNQNDIDIDTWCGEHLLNIHTLFEIRQIRKQVIERMTSLKPKGWMSSPKFDNETHLNIRKALARGLFFNTAVRIRSGQPTFKTVHENQEILTNPRSTIEPDLFDWVVYNEANLSIKPYMDIVTGIDPKWIMDLPHFQLERMPKDTVGYPRQGVIHSALEALRRTT
ncbi:P-loop containing nucleoside triphosphate hydrolase protein, partial [Xylaria palmicola]